MQSLPRSLLVAHSDARIHARLRDAVGREITVENVASWEELADKLSAAPPATLAVVDPYLGSGGGLAPELQRLLRELASVAVLAALELDPRRVGDLRALGEWGVAALILPEMHDAAIRQMLRAARQRALRLLLVRALPAGIGGRARSLFEAAAEAVVTGGQIDDLAGQLHVSLRTLNRQCADAGLPPPGQTLMWVRVLIAAALLDDPRRTVEGVATACGYASDSGLRRVFAQFLGEAPRALRREGAFERACAAFGDALEQGLEPLALSA